MSSALRARRIITLAGESPADSPAKLEAPLPFLDNHVIVEKNGRILAIEPVADFRRRPAAHFPLTDLGDVTLAPGLVNAHCHLELAHLAGKTTLGKGFVPWLQSLIPLASAPVDEAALLWAVKIAVSRMRRSGVVHVGDVGSRNPAVVAQAAEECPGEPRSEAPFGVIHFLEAFGFSPPMTAGLPPELAAQGYCPQAAALLPPERHPFCAVAGHALYSTSPEALRATKEWCVRRKRPFSMHLAEHPEETACLLHGDGPLFDLLRARILPNGWQAPELRPVAYARKLGLLGPLTLAVHGTQCDAADMAALAETRTSLCLCPHSNALINVGTAPAGALAEAGVVLCLGTDSPASNPDMDLRGEMLAAENTWGFSSRATLRMATLNAAHALGLPALGQLAPGMASVFSFVPGEGAPGT